MKNMSLGKLIALVGGSVTVAIILAVIVIKVISGQRPGSAVVTQRYQQQSQQQQPDILAEQLRREQEAHAATRDLLAHFQQAMQQQNQTFVQNLNAIAEGVNALEQRIAALENSRRSTGVEIVKPGRNPLISPIKRLEKEAKPLPAKSGYKVQATVGKRAWIAIGDHEDSVTVGETVPPLKPLVVRAIDNDSGIVITSEIGRR